MEKIIVSIDGRTFKEEMQSASETASFGFDQTKARAWLAEQKEKAFARFSQLAKEKNESPEKPKNVEYVIE